jgi:quercetin dioxygenase-like cupin family protein
MDDNGSSDDARRPAVIPADRIRITGSRTLRFEGKDHGSGVSFYLVTNDPGQGPELHRHPYTETWSVLEGEATIRIGDESIIAHAGDTAVVQRDTWHGFTNTGTGVLRIVCIHASPVMIQEDAAEPLP